MDFLGLRNLSVIDHAQKLAARRDPGFDVERSNRTTGGVPNAGAGALCGGVPVRSGGMKRLLTQAKPRSVED